MTEDDNKLQSRVNRLLQQDLKRKRLSEPIVEKSDGDINLRLANRFKTADGVVVTSTPHLLDQSSTRNLGAQVNFLFILFY